MPPPLKKTRISAAQMLAEGVSAKEAAKRLHTSAATVLGWMQDETMRRAYREAVMNAAVESYARALKRLNEQMDDENPQVAQRAAKEMLDRFQDAVMGGEERELLIKVEGLPELGMPPAMPGGTVDG